MVSQTGARVFVSELTGLDQVWEAQHIRNTNKCMLLCESLLEYLHTSGKTESSSKLRTYELFKNRSEFSYSKNRKRTIQ